MGDLGLPQAAALILFVIAIIAGQRFRRVWKEEGPDWQKWLYGGVAAAGLLSVALIPLQSG
ncbi:MAG: hypothetical protein AAF494_10005 [Pseudomonadota bacterium]